MIDWLERFVFCITETSVSTADLSAASIWPRWRSSLRSATSRSIRRKLHSARRISAWNRHFSSCSPSSSCDRAGAREHGGGGDAGADSSPRTRRSISNSAPRLTGGCGAGRCCARPAPRPGLPPPPDLLARLRLMILGVAAACWPLAARRADIDAAPGWPAPGPSNRTEPNGGPAAKRARMDADGWGGGFAPLFSSG